MVRAVGIHLSSWQTLWSDPLLPLVACAREAGYDGVEVPLLDPQRVEVAVLRAALEANGMQVTCGTGLGRATDITHPDASIRRAGIAHLRACLEVAEALGAHVLGGVTYAPWGVFPTDNRAARRRYCIASLREVGAMAADMGITLCLEVLNRFEGWLLNTVAQGVALLAELDQPSLKLHLDTFHLNIEESDIGAAIRQAGSYLGHVHCSENHRGFPGTGHIPWAEVRAALDAIGYQGWLVVEAFVRPEGEVGRDLYIWRPISETLDADVRGAAQLLRQEVAGA